MSKWKNQLFLTATGALLAVGSSSLLAKEIYPGIGITSKSTVLAQTRTNVNVKEYLEKNKPETYNFLKKQLDKAIEDAKKPSKDKIVNNLWALTKENPQIQTRTKNGKTEFLMVTWVDENSANKYWQPGLQTTKKQTWLTAASQVQQFCHSCKGLDIKNIPGNIMLSLRLQQYLGLILNQSSNKTHFVEMWVKAEDLNRPCIDPEINDFSCNVLPIPIPENKLGLENIYNNSYNNSKKEYYPWTGLGYTYDWGNPQKPHIGASEYMINAIKNEGKGVEVEVITVKPTEEYCNNQYLK
jgi:hypothetical protein